jgi:hypothetical protein
MKKKTAFVALLPLLCCTVSAASAVTADPCTSLSNVVTRPTVTNSVCTVEPNHVLLEAGYTNLTWAAGNGSSVTYPQAFIRVGTSVKGLEAELQLPSENRAGSQHGVGDLGGGLKYLIGYSPRMQYGAQVNLTAPTGDAAFSAGASQSTFSLNGSLALSPNISLTSTQAFASLASGGVRYGSYIPSLVLSLSLPHATSLFAEYAAFTNALGPGTATRSQGILGVSHDVGSRLQLDLEGITSPTKATGSYTGMGFGVSYLI